MVTKATSLGWLGALTLLPWILSFSALPLSAAISQEFYRGGVQEVVPPSSPPTVKSSGCSSSKTPQISKLPSSILGLLGKVKVKAPEDGVFTNCTEDVDPSDGTKSEPILYDHWKLHIIMACTVTAAVEFVLIIFIILYWRQIRWHLRKITCPCDNCRRRESVDAEEQEDEGEDELDFGTIEMGSSPPGNGTASGDRLRHPRGGGDHHLLRASPGDSQHYAATRGSRAVTPSGTVCDAAVPGPSGLGSVRATAGPSVVIGGRLGAYSSDESLSDLEVPPPVISTPAKVPQRAIIKGAKGRAGPVQTGSHGDREGEGCADSTQSDSSDSSSPLLRSARVEQVGRPSMAGTGYRAGVAPTRALSEANLMMARLPARKTRKAGSVQHIYQQVYGQELLNTSGDNSWTSNDDNKTRNKTFSQGKPTAKEETCSLLSPPRDVNTPHVCDQSPTSSRGTVLPPGDCLVQTTADVHRESPATLLSLPAPSMEQVPSAHLT